MTLCGVWVPRNRWRRRRQRPQAAAPAGASAARVTGRLYASGNGYPAAKFGGGQRPIEGYLLRLRPDRVSEARRTFTEMEAGLFEAVPVETESGVAATAYEWIGSIDGLPPIDDGRWTGPEA